MSIDDVWLPSSAVLSALRSGVFISKVVVMLVGATTTTNIRRDARTERKVAMTTSFYHSGCYAHSLSLFSSHRLTTVITFWVRKKKEIIKRSKKRRQLIRSCRTTVWISCYWKTPESEMIQEEEISSAAEQETFASWQTMLMTIFSSLDAVRVSMLVNQNKTCGVRMESIIEKRARARERVQEKKNQRSTLHCLLKIKMQSWDMYLKQVFFSFLRRRLLLITGEKAGDI